MAQDIVSKEFSIDQGSSVIVVITAGDIRGNDVRDFTLALNRTLHNDGKLSNIDNITSIYDIYSQLLLGYTSVVHLELYQTKNATTLASNIEFGIPSTYVTQWISLVNSGSGTVSQTQLAAYNSQAYNSSWPLVLAQTPTAYQTVAFNYLTLFYKSWNLTFTAASYTPLELFVGAFARAQNVTKGSPLLASQPSYYNITLPFVESLPFDAQTLSLFVSAARFFNIYGGGSGIGCSNNNCWNDQNAIRSFTITAVAQAGMANPVQLTIMGEIYDLGASATSSDLASLGLQILRNYNMLTYPVQPSKDVYSQFASAKNDTMLVILDFKTNGPDPMNSVPEIRHDVGIANIISNESLVVYVTGAPAFNYDIQTQTVTDIERIDPITITLILVIVGVFFASLVAPLIPIAAIGLSIGIAFGLVYLVGSYVTSVHYLVLTLLPVSMLGAGSDYCIFLVSRYAEERRLGRGKKDAVERSVTWAGGSIATSGATVVIAFGTLAFASFGLLRSVGIAVMLGISIALLVALTIVRTPVMLVSGGWINVTALKAISIAENSTSMIPGVSKVYGLTHPSGNPIPFASFSQLNSAEQQAMTRSMKPFLGSDGRSAMVWAALASEPYSDEAIATVARIRDNVDVLQSQVPLLASSTMFVGGATASVSDLATSSGSDYFNLTALVLVGVFIVLLVALGSVFTPLRLIFTILLSISWAMAATVYFFKTYFSAELIWILPIMLLVIMVGLGLDYDIFLVTRIREYVAGGAKDEESIETAVERTGGIITVTGLVTAGAYGTMMLSQIPMLQQLGLAIFIVVLLDATLTRIYLVPSIMMMMKRLNWWAPGRLRRVPVRPEEKLIPPIPFITKLIVAAETLAIIALGMILYLDYSSNVFLQMFVQGTIASVLAGINVWTGVILGIASFAATYVILQGKIGQMKPKQWLPKLARWLSGPLTPKSTAHMDSEELGPVSSVTPAVQAQPPLPPTVATPQFDTDHVEAIKKDEATRESTAEPKSTP